MPCDPRRAFRVSLFFLVMLSVAAAPGPLVAQTSDGSSPSRSARDQLYEQLARDAAAIEQASVLKQAVRLVKPTVVHLEAKKIGLPVSNYGARKSREEAGSGVIVELGGKYFVLTNRHVISDAPLKNIRVSLADGRRLQPTAKWDDDGTDVAVMAVTADDLTAARLGDSDKVEIGDFVLAVGSPFGLSHSVTYGIVSAEGRRDLKLGHAGVKYQDFFQTDAAINPGNSGGPLLNLRGEVIGVNTAIASNSGGSEGIGFAIPINMFMVVARQLIENGRVVRSFLGVHLDSQFDTPKAAGLGLRRPQGARVTAITPNSPAESARLQVDDVILEIDGVPIENDSHLVNFVSLTPQDREITLVVWRDRARRVFKIKVGNRADFEPGR
jgi:serine protease Do